MFEAERTHGASLVEEVLRATRGSGQRFTTAVRRYAGGETYRPRSTRSGRIATNVGPGELWVEEITCHSILGGGARAGGRPYGGIQIT